jgi:hypothetical protein
MQGPSLVPYLNGKPSDAPGGRAFSQYFERNRVFDPIKHGTVGVIEGDFQYVYFIDKQLGALRPLEKAEVWDMDFSGSYPREAAALRDVVRKRFPELVSQS